MTKRCPPCGFLGLLNTSWLTTNSKLIFFRSRKWKHSWSRRVFWKAFLYHCKSYKQYQIMCTTQRKVALAFHNPRKFKCQRKWVVYTSYSEHVVRLPTGKGIYCCYYTFIEDITGKYILTYFMALYTVFFFYFKLKTHYL